MSSKMYKQAVLHRSANGVDQEQITWLPIEYAEIGRVLKLKFEDKWIDGWKVVSVGAARPERVVLGFVENARRGLPSGDRSVRDIYQQGINYLKRYDHENIM